MDPYSTFSAAAGVASMFGGNSAKDASKKDRERNRWDYKHRYQWQMEDMKKAGLNPILSAGQSAGMSSATTTAVKPTDKAETALATANAYANLKAVKSQSDLNNSAEAVNRKEVEKKTAEIASIKQNVNTKQPFELLMNAITPFLSSGKDLSDAVHNFITNENTPPPVPTTQKKRRDQRKKKRKN